MYKTLEFDADGNLVTWDDYDGRPIGELRERAADFRILKLSGKTRIRTIDGDYISVDDVIHALEQAIRRNRQRVQDA